MEQSRFEQASRIKACIAEIEDTITKINNVGPNIAYVIIRSDTAEEVLRLNEMKYLLSDMLGSLYSRVREMKDTLETEFNSL